MIRCDARIIIDYTLHACCEYGRPAVRAAWHSSGRLGRSARGWWRRRNGPCGRSESRWRWPRRSSIRHTRRLGRGKRLRSELGRGEGQADGVELGGDKGKEEGSESAWSLLIMKAPKVKKERRAAYSHSSDSESTVEPSFGVIGRL